MSRQSSSDGSTEGPPLIPPDSPGSSISSRLQEEYDELLKYAVVVPDFNPQDHLRSRPYDGFSGRGAINQENDIITITGHSARSSLVRDTERMRLPESKSEEEQETSGGTDDRHGRVHEDWQSPIAPKSSFTEHLQSTTPESFGGFSNPLVQPIFPEADLRGIRSCRDDDISDNDRVGEDDKTREELKTIFTATIDRDVGKMDTLLEQWCLDLKRHVLAEFSQAKLIVEQKTRVDLKKEVARHSNEKVELIRELDTMKEYLHSFEQSMHRKDAIISNLTKAMFRMRDKMELMRNFCTWRIQHNDSKRENFSLLMAEKHYERSLNRKVLCRWFSTIHNKWRQRVEKACQVKAQEICLQVTSDYEAKIASLNEALEASREEVRRLHIQRERYEEAMKKAFMRGVCALNIEAMSMFHGDEGADSEADPRQAGAAGSGDDYFSDNLDTHVPDKCLAVSKSIPHDTVRASVAGDATSPRIVTSQGSRSIPASIGPRPSSAKTVATSTTTSAHKSLVTVKVPGRGGHSSQSGGGRSVSPPLRPPMASVVVERHNPVNKQTIGHATASRFPRTSSENDKFRRLAGQGNVNKNPPIQTVRVVD